jgi:hypothetical protein
MQVLSPAAILRTAVRESSRRNRMRRSITEILLFVAIVTPGIAFAQSSSVESKKLPTSFLKKVVPRTAHVGDSIAAFGRTKGNAGTGKKTAATSGLPGVDSVENWSDQFVTPGFDSSGSPQSVWPYTMVGTPPESGERTKIQAPIVPVTLDLLGPDGKVAVYHGQPLTFSDSPEIVKALVKSPIFEPFAYNSGTGQFNDQLMRTQFWDRIHHSEQDNWGDDNSDEGWHILLRPSVKTTRRMQIPFGFWFFFVDGNGNVVAAAVDGNTFGNLLFPTTVPVDNTTPIGAAELAGDITTRDISTFFFNNVYLYNGDISTCCVLGYHTYDFEPGDSSNGNRERRYVLNYSSWITNGLFFFGFEDITPSSHEISETFDDPFVNDATPWWLSVDPFLGSGLCQNNLENGDVIEVLTANPVFATSLNGRTYHPQNVALFSWFAFQSPSHARHGAYSFPDETTLTSLSPNNLLPGCTPAP